MGNKESCFFYLMEEDSDTWVCSKCGLAWALTDSGTPFDHEMYYCPKCGRVIQYVRGISYGDSNNEEVIENTPMNRIMF